MGKVYILDARQIVGNCALFWRPKGEGYTCDLNDAGLYEPGHSGRETDIEIPEYVARQCAVTHVRIDTLRDVMDQRGTPIRSEKRARGRR